MKKLKLIIHDWQCRGCYSTALQRYANFHMSKEKDAPLCCCTPMLPVNKIVIKVKRQ
jgi:hypothetical protein